MAPLDEATSSQKRSGMARVVKDYTVYLHAAHVRVRLNNCRGGGAVLQCLILALHSSGAPRIESVSVSDGSRTDNGTEFHRLGTSCGFRGLE